MGSIVTFYSYKGGVGRSMALANVAVLLANAGRRVLVIDFDLEAPGIEQYFLYFEAEPSSAGILDLLDDLRAGRKRSFQRYVTHLRVSAEASIDLLASGRERDPTKYLSRLNALDWEDFFRAGGGNKLEALRDQWKRDYDVVLIDSRTGLSDSGGVCTIQLPDVLAVMFTANNQSLLGARDAARLAIQARQTLSYTRMSLTVLPIPSRVGVNEFALMQEWMERFAEEFAELMSDWVPKDVAALDVLRRLKIPQHDYFGFGERLAVIEQGTSDFAGMSHSYQVIASLIENDFHDPKTLLQVTPRSTPDPYVSSRGGASLLYDVFVSYPKGYSDVSRQLIRNLRTALSDRLGREARVFMDQAEILTGTEWQKSLAEQLTSSASFIALLTPSWFHSKWNQYEWDVATMRNRKDGLPIFPVVLQPYESSTEGSSIVDVGKFPMIDLSAYLGGSKHRLSDVDPSLFRAINELADAISKRLIENPTQRSTTPAPSSSSKAKARKKRASKIPAP